MMQEASYTKNASNVAQYHISPPPTINVVWWYYRIMHVFHTESLILGSETPKMYYVSTGLVIISSTLIEGLDFEMRLNCYLSLFRRLAKIFVSDCLKMVKQ